MNQNNSNTFSDAKSSNPFASRKRKIRTLNLDDSQVNSPAEETKKAEIIHTPKKSEAHERQDLYKREDESSAKSELIRCIHSNLENPTGQNLIGVFGINSDSIVSQALAEIRTESNVLYLGNTEYVDNPYRLIASKILRLAEEQRSISYRNGYRNITIEGINNNIKRNLIEISSSTGEIRDVYSRYDDYDDERGYGSEYRYWDDENDLERLCLLSTRFDRPTIFRQTIGLLQDLMRRNDIKFVWNIETSFRGLNYNLLNDLSQIACDDLLIIVSSSKTVEMEASNLGRSYGSADYGHQILYKFFPINNLIFT